MANETENTNKAPSTEGKMNAKGSSPSKAKSKGTNAKEIAKGKPKGVDKVNGITRVNN